MGFSPLNNRCLGKAKLFAIHNTKPGDIFHVLAVIGPAGLGQKKETLPERPVLKTANTITI